MTFCLERLQMHLGGSEDITHVVFEKRGEKEDRELELEFRRICDGGNALKKDDQLPFKAIFADKQTNSSGLQFSDLVARPIGLHHLRPDQANRAWDVLEGKLRKKPGGGYAGRGLKTFP